MTGNEDRNLKRGWKDHFLKSGVPLEYQVARILAAEDMSVDADFSFLRRDLGKDHAKEWSIDIAANWFGPDASSIPFTLQMLIECKYRSPNKLFLFLQEPNDEFPPVTIGGTVNSFDHFVLYTLPHGVFEKLERSCAYVYKGIELFEKGAYDEDIRHGVQQLRYAAPACIRKAIDFYMTSDLTSAVSIFFVKILVTNAPLRILRRDATLGAIEQAEAIEDISDSVEKVILYSDYGPDFEDHFKSVFSDSNTMRARSAGLVGQRLRAAGKKIDVNSDPARLVRDFASANRFQCSAVSTQFFIVSLSALPSLISELKQGCLTSYKKRRVLKTAKKLG